MAKITNNSENVGADESISQPKIAKITIMVVKLMWTGDENHEITKQCPNNYNTLSMGVP